MNKITVDRQGALVLLSQMKEAFNLTPPTVNPYEDYRGHLRDAIDKLTTFVDLHVPGASISVDDIVLTAIKQVSKKTAKPATPPAGVDHHPYRGTEVWSGVEYLRGCGYAIPDSNTLSNAIQCIHREYWERTKKERV